MNVYVENSFQMSEFVPFVTFRQRSEVRYVSRKGNCHQCEFQGKVENAVLKMSPHQLLRARLSNDLAVSLAPPLLLDHPVHLQGVTVLLGVLAEGQGDVRLSHDLLVLGAVFVVVVVIVGRHRPWRPVVGRVRWLAAVTAVVNGVI